MSGRFFSSAFFFLALAYPAAGQWSVTSHLASDGTLSGSPYVAGASLSSLTRQMGMRMGFSIDASGTAMDLPARPRTALTVDFDGLYYPFGSPAKAGIAPYGFLGLGGRSSSEASGREVLTGSYGSGVDLYLNEYFGLQMETRRRVPLNASSIDEAVHSSGWEYRFGVTFRFGGKGRDKSRKLPAPRPVRPVVFEKYEAPPPAPAPVRTTVALATIDMAEEYIGVPYKWGGTTPRGFDCSGLVQYVYRANGIHLPRVSRDQARAGVSIPSRIDMLQAGDLMFFASNGSRVDHVAIYTGDGHILHASKSKGEVGYDDLWSRRGEWYRRHFVAARRVIPGDGAAEVTF